jgi:hypothetical protein
MARDNRLWGAERIRGEWLKLGLRVCTRTIQTYMRQVRASQATETELENLLPHSCRADLGLRLSPGHRFAFPIAVRLLHHRITLAQSDPRWRHTLPYRRLDRITAAGGYRLWRGAEVSHSG